MINLNHDEKQRELYRERSHLAINGKMKNENTNVVVGG
jgi:hypothetical protein